MQSIGFIPRRTFREVLFWPAARSNCESPWKLLLIVTLSCKFVYPESWAGFIKATKTGQQQRLPYFHFLQILKWEELVRDKHLLGTNICWGQTFVCLCIPVLLGHRLLEVVFEPCVGKQRNAYNPSLHPSPSSPPQSSAPCILNIAL